MSFFQFQAQSISLSCASRTVVVFSAITLGVFSGHSDAAAPITPSGLNTQVSQPAALPGGQTQYNITGGTRPGGGTNLFHSFGDFNVPTNNIANFLNDSGLATSNILGRVTGGSPSRIFGAIQTNGLGGFGNANFFLMNPAGVIFGPTATLNIGGMATFTTADYLRLGEAGGVSGIFYASPSANSILTTAPVAAFGFLGANPTAITVQGSQLGVQPGQTLSLVGGDLTIQAGPLVDNTVQPAKLTAPGGQINLVSVASPGEVLFSNLQPAPNINGQSFAAMGNINLSQGALLDVSANAAGAVRIRGGQLVMNNATISADTVNANGAPVAIDINLTGDLSITANAVPALTARTTGTGDGGEIRINAQNVHMTATGPEDFTPFAVIDTHTAGLGKAGDVAITATGDVTLSGDPSSSVFAIDTGTVGPDGGHGGNVTITAGNVQLTSVGVNTGDFIATQTFQDSAGSGGDVTITADTFHMSNSAIATDGLVGGSAGAITISARDVQIKNNSFLDQQGINGTGKTEINATDFLMNNGGQIISLTAFAPGGGITINAKTVTLTNGSTIQSQTVGNAPAGDIRINATNHVTLADDSVTFENADIPTNFGALFRPSGLFTNSLGGPLGNLGPAGAVIVTTPQLTMSGGARIDTTTQTSGHGGNISITANSISISGQRNSPPIEAGFFDLGGKLSSGVFTRTIGSEFCTGTCGAAGQISITTGSLSLTNGALINSSTASTGQGGNITVHATDGISLSGTLTDGTPGGIFSQTTGTDAGSGSGGNITLHAGHSVTVSDGAQVSASTTGPGNAGNITIQGLGQGPGSPAQSVLIDGGTISTDTQGSGAGGNILVNANSVTLSNSGTLSATTSGAGNGGNILVDATTINLHDFGFVTALSSSSDGPAGNAGNISLQATQQITVVDSFLNTDTVGGSGLAGNISLRAPTINVNTAVMSTSTSGTGNAGNILLEGQQIHLGATPTAVEQGADVFSITSGTGHGGTITLRGLNGPSSSADSIMISGFSRVHTLTTADGDAGHIAISAGHFTMTDHGSLNADTFGSGSAGLITVAATEQATLSGNSIISSSSDFGATGHAGQVMVSAPTVLIDNGGQIVTNTTGGGAGGDITIAAGQSVALSNGANISASSTGTGNAGNIQITAGNQFTMINSSVATEATQSSGGSIKITTNPSGTVELSNSTISASVLDGTGGGGSVSIDPQFVILQNSQILAQAQQGPGGNILINITNGGLFLPDSTSVVSASSQFGQQGTVTIQAPIAPAGGKIQPLGKAPLQVTALLSQRCAAIARGEVSSFVVTGRDTLPTEPGGWLTSPLASTSSYLDSSVQAGLLRIPPHSDESLFVSLRRLPSWKMAQVIEDDWIAGCGS